MASTSQSPKKGDWAPPSASDVRSPCPVLNSLANTGHLNRTGRDITLDELKGALHYLGVGPDLIAFLANGAFKVHSTTAVAGGEPFGPHGLRDTTDVNEQGVKVLSLEKVGRPDAVEHDVSITRQDRAVGDYRKANPDLVEQALQASANGKTVARDDLIQLRLLRYQQQKERNPDLKFTPETHQTCAGELALLQGIFGQGLARDLPVPYLRALFKDERLPVDEGWRPRWTWCTFLEIFGLRFLIEGPSSPFKGGKE